jgi:DNA-binding response OmpR family regulator
MRILIADNRNDIRIEWFTEFCKETPDITIATDSILARQCIDMYQYDYVFIDQDLEDVDSGMNVVNYIANNLQNRKENIPRNVVIHSLSGKGSHEMELTLMRAAYDNMRILRRPYFHNEKLHEFVRNRV